MKKILVLLICVTGLSACGTVPKSAQYASSWESVKFKHAPTAGIMMTLTTGMK